MMGGREPTIKGRGFGRGDLKDQGKHLSKRKKEKGIYLGEKRVLYSVTQRGKFGGEVFLRKTGQRTALAFRRGSSLILIKSGQGEGRQCQVRLVVGEKSGKTSPF